MVDAGAKHLQEVLFVVARSVGRLNDLEAERIAPEEVRYNVTAWGLLRELVSGGSVTAGLREMAGRLRVAA